MPGIGAAVGIALFEAGVLASVGAAATFATVFNALGGIALSFAANKLTAKKPSTDGLGQGRTVTVRDPVKPRPVIYGRTRVGGTIVYISTSPQGGRANGYLNLVIALAGHECEEIGTVYFDDYAVPLTASGAGFITLSGRYWGSDQGHVYIEKHLGADDQAASSWMTANFPGWTSAHRLRGITYLTVRLQWSPDIFPNGVPNITAILKGKKIWDTRTETTAYSANPALILRDYLTDATYGLGCAADEIDDDLVSAAANECDENVTLAGGGTQDRYTCNGTFTTDESPNTVIPALLSAMAGKAIWSGGVWRVFAGAYLTPTVTLDEDDLRAGFRTVSRVTRRELFNAVKGTYVAPANQYQPADFPPITNSTYETQDNGERIWKDVTLPYTDTPAMAQRIAKIDLERGRQQISIPSLPCKLTAFRVRAGDVIGLTNERKGWSEKPFEVTSWQLVVEGDDDAPVFGVDLSLREIASTVYDWNSGEETEVDDAPDTSLPDPFDVSAPGAPVVTEALYETRNSSGVKALATLVWEESDDAFVIAYQPEYRLSGATEWTVLPRTPDLTAEILDIDPGTYEFRVKALNALGVSSDYSPTTTRTIQGLGAPPSQVTGLRIQTVSALAVLTWTRHPDLDVKIGGRIEFRHSPSTAPGVDWTTSTGIGEPVAGGEALAVLPLRAGTYLARAVDSIGIRGAPATVTTDGAEALSFTTLETVTESPTFPGTHDGTEPVDDGTLRLAPVGLFDDIPDFDAVDDLNSYGGIGLSGTYTFDAGIDLSSVKRARLTATVSALISNVQAQIDSRTENIDDWADFDGTDGSEADAQIYVRQTDTDPAGSPTWSEWRLMTAGDFEARAFQFQARLTSTDPSYNILIDALSVTAEEVN